MKRAWMASIAALPLLALGTVASADPAGVGVATVERGFNCYVGALASGPDVTPLYPGTDLGVVQVVVTNSTFVIANSANGNTNLSCHGQVDFGSTVTAYDPVTRNPITVTLATREESCTALEPLFPNVCRGNGAVILNTSTIGMPCQIVPGLFTNDWRQITAPSGEVSLTCQTSD